MSKNKLTILGIVIIVLGIFAFSSLFTVHQTRQALVLQFGGWKRTITEPGLYVKLPFLQNVVEYDRRILSFDPPAETVILSDQKRMIVDAFVRYQIDDPLRFYQTVRSEAGVLSRLNGVVDSSLRGVLGNVTLLTVLSDERTKIMNDIKIRVNEVAQRFGIKIVDVRLRRADLPDQAAQAIYARMRSEREREAREARAQGFEKAQEIRSSADRERSVLLAEAEKHSEITRGVGDKTAIRIYAEAYGADPEFYAFYRSMQAYRKAFADDDTTMVLSPDSDFFRYFGNLSGGVKSGGN